MPYIQPIISTCSVITLQEKPIKQSFYYKSFICKINFLRSSSRSFSRSSSSSRSNSGSRSDFRSKSNSGSRSSFRSRSSFGSRSNSGWIRQRATHCASGFVRGFASGRRWHRLPD